MDREGNKEVRSLLVELAQQARRESHPLHPLYSSILFKKGNSQMAASVVAAKMVQIVWRMLRDKEKFDPGKIGVRYVLVETIRPSGRKGYKMVAVKKRNLKRYLKEHNLTEEYVMEVMDRELAKEWLKNLSKKEK